LLGEEERFAKQTIVVRGHFARLHVVVKQVKQICINADLNQSQFNELQKMREFYL
jgi:hypothetical protein